MSSIRDDSSKPRKRQANGASRSNKTANINNQNNIVAKDGTGARTGQDADQGLAATVKGVVLTAVPTWINVVVMMSLIFGGCCANVRFPDEWLGRYVWILAGC